VLQGHVNIVDQLARDDAQAAGCDQQHKEEQPPGTGGLDKIYTDGLALQ